VANIADGSARRGRADFGRFLDQALGSLAEVDALMDLTLDLGYFDRAQAERIGQIRERASRLTFGLRRKMRA